MGESTTIYAVRSVTSAIAAVIIADCPVQVPDRRRPIAMMTDRKK